MWGWILFGVTWLYAGATTAAALLQIETVGQSINEMLPDEKKMAVNLKGRPKLILFVVVIFWPASLLLWLYWGITER